MQAKAATGGNAVREDGDESGIAGFDITCDIRRAPMQ